jgi:hypothetical protein
MKGLLGPFSGHRRAGVEVDLSIMAEIGLAGGGAEKGLGSWFGGAQNQALTGGVKWPAWGVLFLRRVWGCSVGVSWHAAALAPPPAGDCTAGREAACCRVSANGRARFPNRPCLSPLGLGPMAELASNLWLKRAQQ